MLTVTHTMSGVVETQNIEHITMSGVVETQNIEHITMSGVVETQNFASLQPSSSQVLPK